MHQKSKDRKADPQFYKGAKDLLGTQAILNNKDIIMGIGAANRFRRNSVKAHHKSQATAVSR